MNRDEKVRSDVLEELRWDPQLDEAKISVHAKGGTVTLSGHVDTYTEKRAAEMAARRVHGVRWVVEEIEVRLPDHRQISDTQIAASIKERFASNSSIPTNSITVEVTKGRVKLTGDLPWHYQKEAASNDIRRIRGVVEILNAIIIEPKATSGDISENIMHALHRSHLDPHGIFVTGYDGKITLSGTVNSWHDYDLAFSTAWAERGTTNVQNDISLV